MCGREMEGKGGRGKRVGGRLERASARGQVATKNQGTSEPPSSHARNLQLPPSRPRRYTYTLLLGPQLDSRQTSGGSTLEKRITRLGNVGHEGPDRCVRLVRNLNITTVSLRGPVPRTGPLRAIPRHPLRPREWCAGDAGCPVIVKSSVLSTKETKDTLEYQSAAGGS